MEQNTRVALAKAAITQALQQYNTEDCGKLVIPAEASMELVGSTYIADEQTRDVDILVLIPDADLSCIFFSDWQYGGSVGMGNESDWMSWKCVQNGLEINMLLTNKKTYFNAWLTAAEVCRFLFLKGIKLPSAAVHGIHEIIMDDSTADVEITRRNY